ncbi:cupin domain-containing protein [Heliocybe sulcata]|uniref:Cupin domain-containing protein n=1 Tax=Heliocybe sulcata TaxID=5364 RepID=A0A5C3MR59_9AGAM|nr:cupin domain-containing protein [Heliocybe sulcata]
MSSIANALSDVKVETYHIPRHGRIPNSDPTSKPLIYYQSLFKPGASKTAIKDYVNSIKVVEPQWTYTMYPTSHFHSTSHEAIMILTGSALLLFGGEGNPGKVELEVKAGDALLIPAGVAHRQLKEIGLEVFEMMGAYPIRAEHWDMCYGLEEEGDTEGRIKRLDWFKEDPFFGQGGPAAKV